MNYFDTICPDKRLPDEVLKRLRDYLRTARLRPIPKTCPICYEDCIYSLPENDSKYTHLFCCSKSVCDVCMSKMQRTTCPFCNQSIIDIVIGRNEATKSYRNCLIAGVFRNDVHSMFSLSLVLEKKYPDIAKKLLRVTAAVQFQPAMFRLALMEFQQIVSEVTPSRMLAAIMQDKSPTEDAFKHRLVPMLKKIIPCNAISDSVEKLAEKEPVIRDIAIANGIPVKCNFCRNHCAKYMCACQKVVYCNQMCQARHWNYHHCDSEKVQLVGLSTRKFNGMIGKRTKFVEKSSRYAVEVVMEEDSTSKTILVKPENTFVIT